MASRRNQFWLIGAKSIMGRIKKAQMIEETAKEPGWDELVHKCPSWRPLRLRVEGLGEGLTGPAWVSTPPCLCWQESCQYDLWGGLSGARVEEGYSPRWIWDASKRRVMEVGGSDTIVYTTVPILQMRKVLSAISRKPQKWSQGCHSSFPTEVQWAPPTPISDFIVETIWE